jgi:methionine-rich copper-binding protein CopC
VNIRRISRAFFSLLLCALCALFLFAGAALAHGDLEDKEPKEGARLKKPPKHAYLTFTETPTNDSSLKVVDGCDENVVTKLEKFDVTLHAELGRGQPGEWTVRYDVVSNEDGHETKGSYTFTVKGSPDCDGSDTAGQGDPDGEVAPSLPSDDSGFPIVPVAMGAVVLIGGAILIRVQSSR